jgi:hypothetical protein
VVAVVCLSVAAGCTMCPDPFDYSGPVPNGSSPQNDFRARSNGIRPLLAAPKPWPPVVQAEPGKTPESPDGEGASPPSVLVAGGPATSAEGEGGVVPVVNTAGATETAPPAGAPSPAAPPAPDDQPAGRPAAAARQDVSAADAPSPDDGAAADAAPRGPEAAEQLRDASAGPAPGGTAAAEAETPGWRRRGPRRLE